MPSPSDSIESTFSFLPQKKDTEAITIHFLKSFGFLRTQLVQTYEKGWAQIRVYSSALTQSRRLANAFKKTKLPHVRLFQRTLAYQAWAEKWKEDYQTQALGRSFVIVPAWRRKEFDAKKFKNRVPIWMDPLSAFGSGEHETTRLIVRLMELLHFDSFLDVGVGTGILSIVAAHRGANQIFGFDSDKPSAECATFNFSQNGFGQNKGSFVCQELAGFKHKKLFDLVCANINSRTLENYRHEIVRSAKKGGWVLVSGILRQTYGSFREVFDGADLKCFRILRGRRWVAILYKKR